MPPPAKSTESNVQDFIHAIEQGRFAGAVRGITVLVVVVAIALAYLGWNFHGFSKLEAMDQAQVAREIARGHGWSTKFQRPLAIWQIEKNIGSPPRGAAFPDTYNAPLPPLVNALAVKLAGDSPEIKRGEIFPNAERLIVILSMICFLAAVLINYFLLVRLFDRRLALFASGLTLVTDMYWQYTLSGLPQMLMLLLFSAALYALVRALQAHWHLATPESEVVAETAEGAEVPIRQPMNPLLAVAGWLAVAGVFFGLLALSHALTICLFLGALGFALAQFRGRRVAVLTLAVAFAVVYTPWLIRTYHVSGNPFGVAGYAMFEGLGDSTFGRMRSNKGPNTEEVAPYFFRPKVEHGLVNQFNGLAQSLGGNLLALAFFVSLLHGFRRPETSALRWGVLCMWGSAMLAMAILGVDGEPMTGPSRLGVLFLPVMLGFGLAFILVLFGRLEVSASPLVRIGFFSALFLLTALPMIVTLLPERSSPHQYPPYFPPAINRLHDWTTENEIIGSDMPWAVAWYADRKSIWIPGKLRDFLGMSDEQKLNGPLAGMFLTPISRGTPFVSSIYKGEYQEYAQLIFGNTNLPFFPFRETAFVLGDLNYTFYSDTRRWDRKDATP